MSFMKFFAPAYFFFEDIKVGTHNFFLEYPPMKVTNYRTFYMISDFYIIYCQYFGYESSCWRQIKNNAMDASNS